MPQQLEETGSGDGGSHDQVTPPATPPSQPEDACTGSSGPSSPRPEDSLSSGGEQGSLPEDGPPFVTPGGQLEYDSSLFWAVPDAVVSGEGHLLLSSASSTWSNSVESPDPLENDPLSDEGQ